MHVFVCITFLYEKLKVGVTLQYFIFNLRSRYKRHSMQLVKSYLLISEYVAIVLLIAAESATKSGGLTSLLIGATLMRQFFFSWLSVVR